MADSDFLDGCAIDFKEHAEDDATAELRALFPQGRDDAGWVEFLRSHPELVAVPREAAPAYRGSGYDLGLADRLRRFCEPLGLRVVEVEGWQSAGSESFRPGGSVNHHTAGPRLGNSPSLNVIINGREDLPGPLANVYLSRDNVVYVIAAGRTNHAGKGGWRGLSGNSSVYGLEWENPGTAIQPVRADQLEAMAAIHAAFLAGIGQASAENVCQHYEWAPLRKIDAFGVGGSNFRRMVEAALNQPEEQEMNAEQEKKLDKLLKGMEEIQRGVLVDIAEGRDDATAKDVQPLGEILTRVRSMHSGQYGETTDAARGDLRWLDRHIERVVGEVLDEKLKPFRVVLGLPVED